MTDYPKSSCDCYDCKRQNFTHSGTPSNLSVRNCDFSKYECGNKFGFKKQIEPRGLKGYNNINPNVWEDSYDKNFHPVECKNNKGCTKVYASTDPRLVSAAHGGQVMTLDRPPITTDIKLKDIYTDKSLQGYGQNYKTYSDINAGQIMYYTDKSRQDAFYEPLFSSSAMTHGTLYKDPMGAMKPQYDRVPLKCNDPLNTDMNRYEGGLSWIQDSQNHRQDLLAKQMRKHNEQRWMPRWN